MKENISVDPSLQTAFSMYQDLRAKAEVHDFTEWLHSWSELEKQISERKAWLTRRSVEDVDDDQAVSANEWLTAKLAEFSPLRQELYRFAIGNPALPASLLSNFKAQLLNELGAETGAQIEIEAEKYRRYKDELILTLN